jgi:hypothetical protein
VIHVFDVFTVTELNKGFLALCHIKGFIKPDVAETNSISIIRALRY